MGGPRTHSSGPGAAHLGGLAGHGPRAAGAELLQARPGEEQHVLLGEQVRAPQDGDGAQGSLWTREGVSRLHPEGRVPRTSWQPHCPLCSPPTPLPGRPRKGVTVSARSPTPPHHLRVLAGPAQAAGQQLQHRLAVEQPTPAGGAPGRTGGQAGGQALPSGGSGEGGDGGGGPWSGAHSLMKR